MPKRHINSDKWDQHLYQPEEGLFCQTLETIKRRHDKIVRHTVKRTYFDSGEYMDSELTEIICDATK